MTQRAISSALEAIEPTRPFGLRETRALGVDEETVLRSQAPGRLLDAAHLDGDVVGEAVDEDIGEPAAGDVEAGGPEELTLEDVAEAHAEGRLTSAAGSNVSPVLA